MQSRVSDRITARLRSMPSSDDFDALIERIRVAIAVRRDFVVEALEAARLMPSSIGEEWEYTSPALSAAAARGEDLTEALVESYVGEQPEQVLDAVLTRALYDYAASAAAAALQAIDRVLPQSSETQRQRFASALGEDLSHLPVDTVHALARIASNCGADVGGRILSAIEQIGSDGAALAGYWRAEMRRGT